MNATLTVAIDPYLVSLPDHAGSAEELERFVQGLMAWADMLRSTDVTVCISQICLAAILQEGIYPFSYSLRQLVREFALTHISSDMVSKVAQTVLELTPYLEDHIDVAEVYYSDAVTAIEPDYFVGRLRPLCRGPFRSSLVSLAAWRSIRGSIESLIIASHRANHQFETEVNVESEVEGLCDQAQMVAEFRPPRRVNESFDVLFGYNDLLSSRGVCELFGDATRENGVLDAINLRITEHLSRGVPAQSRKVYSLGSHFLESIRGHGFVSRRDLAYNLVDSCARIILNIPKNEVKPFRVSEDSGEQRCREDGALAWRTHLTKHGPAYRLMFWTLTNGTLELANVGTKSECRIQ